MKFRSCAKTVSKRRFNRGSGWFGGAGAFLKTEITTKGRPFVAAKIATDYFEMQVIRAFQDKISMWQILRRKSYKISDRE